MKNEPNELAAKIIAHYGAAHQQLIAEWLTENENGIIDVMDLWERDDNAVD